MRKPHLLTETRGPRGLTEAALQLFPGQASAPIQPDKMYPAEMIRKVCKNFDNFFAQNEGEATVELIDMHSMKVLDWAQANVEDYDYIHTEKKCRDADELR